MENFTRYVFLLPHTTTRKFTVELLTIHCTTWPNPYTPTHQNGLYPQYWLTYFDRFCWILSDTKHFNSVAHL